MTYVTWFMRRVLMLACLFLCGFGVTDAEAQRRRSVSSSSVEVYALPTPYITQIAATADGTIWWQGAVMGALSPNREVRVVDRGPGYSGGFAVTTGGRVCVSANGDRDWAALRCIENGRTSTIRVRPNAGITDVASDRDERIWFVEREKDRLGRLGPDDVVTEIALPPTLESPRFLTVDLQRSSLWLTARRSVAELSPDGLLREYSAETLFSERSYNAGFASTALASDGSLWLSLWPDELISFQHQGGAIVRMTGDGRFEPILSLPLDHYPLHLTPGADGSIWFVDHNYRMSRDTLRRVWKDGTQREYVVPSPSPPPPYYDYALSALTRDANGDLWIALSSWGGGSYLMNFGR